MKKGSEAGNRKEQKRKSRQVTGKERKEGRKNGDRK